MRALTVTARAIAVISALLLAWAVADARADTTRVSGSDVDTLRSAVAPADSLLPELCPDRFAVYYFHPTLRCESCLRIEAWSHIAVERGFAEELKAGSLEWQVFNFEDKENVALAKLFGVEGSTLVVVQVLAGKPERWKALDDVWYLVGGEQAPFLEYVEREVRAFGGTK